MPKFGTLYPDGLSLSTAIHPLRCVAQSAVGPQVDPRGTLTGQSALAPQREIGICLSHLARNLHMQLTEGRRATPAGALAGLSRSIARRWPTWFVLVTGAWVVVPWLAPLFMELGWEGPAQAVYWVYSFQCHQLPQRSFFLFGQETMYSLGAVQAAWSDSLDPLVLRQFVGNAQMGYKVAWSDRMVSAYSSIPLAALVWYLLRKRLRPLSLVGMLLLMAPMVIDGATHMLSDLSGIGQGFRYGNEWLVGLTSNALPAAFYRGTGLGSFNSWMRLITGVLFGLALIWFTLPRLYLTTAPSE